jgi:hypothetical protein
MGRAPWERLPEEPANWHRRFLAYRDIGPGRRLEEAFRRVAAEEGLGGQRPGGAWREAAERYRWRERAEAWDQAQREQLAQGENARRFDARERRRRVIDALLAQVVEAVAVADLPHMDLAAARDALPTLRMMLRDLLRADRLEMGEPTVVTQEVDANALVSADDLVGAARELEKFARGEASLATELEAGRFDISPGGIVRGRLEPEAGKAAEPTVLRLLVLAGSGPEMQWEMAALREVRRATGLGFTRLAGVTKESFEREMLRARRRKGGGYTWLHMAAHGWPDGAQFAGEFAEGNWLSERLEGFEVALLAGCTTDAVGDWLAVIPHVVSFGENVSAGDAGAFTTGFWTCLAQGGTPDAAVDAGLKAALPYVAEYVVRHW